MISCYFSKMLTILICYSKIYTFSVKTWKNTKNEQKSWNYAKKVSFFLKFSKKVIFSPKPELLKNAPFCIFCAAFDREDAKIAKCCWISLIKKASECPKIVEFQKAHFSISGLQMKSFFSSGLQGRLGSQVTVRGPKFFKNELFCEVLQKNWGNALLLLENWTKIPFLRDFSHFRPIFVSVSICWLRWCCFMKTFKNMKFTEVTVSLHRRADQPGLLIFVEFHKVSPN